MAKKNKFPWDGRIDNHCQIGGIETSVIDDGPGRGNRIAWVNTGTGLRFKVVIDRAMDIVDAFYNQHSLAWVSHGGITAPRPHANSGLEWLYSFAGGLVTTCGLTHVGGPEDDELMNRGLHDRISNLPASIESIIQPDPVNGKLDMSITGIVKHSMLFGPNLEMRRTISCTLGSPVISIRDVVTNRGNTPCPHMLLYHCNFGYPLVDAGADIVYKGTCVSFGRDVDNKIFKPGGNYRKCRKPLESHRGFGESCGVIDATPDSKGFCNIGICNGKLPLAVCIKYKKRQLPALTNWQHWGPGDYVTGLEPGTNPPIGQNTARAKKKLIMLAAGKSRTTELQFTVLTDPKKIKTFARTGS
ncbi:MAG: DUF4432 domain-containing protein [Planctomycetota bacterium]|nr:MAG: DUF4432 domain-containing protein [Planctomycetota bacterium]